MIHAFFFLPTYVFTNIIFTENKRLIVKHDIGIKLISCIINTYTYNI